MQNFSRKFLKNSILATKLKKKSTRGTELLEEKLIGKRWKEKRGIKPYPEKTDECA